MVDIRGYYVEARLHEVEQRKQDMLNARLAQAENKSFKEILADIDKVVLELQQEIQKELIETVGSGTKVIARRDDLNTSKGVEAFFSQVSDALKTIPTKG